MNYTLHQLQVFLKIAQTESITKAAEELHLTQPAVSIQLKNFQEQFDIPLTEVIGRKIHITEFGREIAGAAQKILNEVHAINYRTLAYKGMLTGRLTISVVSTGKYVMPYFLSGFLKEHPGIELVMDVTNKSKVLESLKNNEVDFALVSLLPDRLMVDSLNLMKNKLYFVGPSDAELPKHPIQPESLKDYPLIYREDGSGTRLTMLKFLDETKIMVNKKIELTSNEAVKQAVVSGLGYSIMPLIGLKNELQNGDIHILPVKGLPVETTWQLIWLKDKTFSPVAKAYTEYIKKERDNIIDRNFSWHEKY